MAEKLLNVDIKRGSLNLFSFREQVISFSLDITDRAANTVQVDIPMMSARIKILTNEPLGTYDGLASGDTVLVYSDEQIEGGQPVSPIKLYLQTATHYTTKGELELACVREELTDKVPFKGIVYVAPGLSDFMLDAVSIEGDKKIQKRYDVSIDSEYKSDYTIALAWTRPWNESAAPFRPNSIALLPYLGQLTTDSKKSVELFNTGYPTDLDDNAPVYYADSTCIVDMDIESAQPPVTDILIAQSEEAEFTFEPTFSVDGYRTVRLYPDYTMGYEISYPDMIKCDDTGMALLVSGSTFTWSDGVVVNACPVRPFSDSDASYAIAAEWGYTREQYNVMFKAYYGDTGFAGWLYAPRVITRDEVMFYNDTAGIIVIVDRYSMRVKQQLTMPSGGACFGPVRKLNDVGNIEVYVVLSSSMQSSGSVLALALTHNKTTDTWAASTIVSSGVSFSNVSFFKATIAVLTSSDPTPVLVAVYRKVNSSSSVDLIYCMIYLNNSAQIRTMFKSRSLYASHYPWMNTDYWVTEFTLYDIQIDYADWSVMSQPHERFLIIARRNQDPWKLLLIHRVVGSQPQYDVYTFLGFMELDQNSYYSANPIFLGTYPHPVHGNVPPIFYPMTSSFWFNYTSAKLRVVNVADNFSSYQYQDKEVSSFAPVALLSQRGANYMSIKHGGREEYMMFYEKPFSAVRSSSKFYTIKVAKGEEHRLEIPGLVDYVRANKGSFDVDKGRVTLQIQKVGYSPGSQAGDSSPSREVGIDKLPLLATGAYMKVFPSGKYGDPDQFLMRVTGYKLDYEGVAIATVEGIIVGEQGSPSLRYEYIVNSLPNWIWNDGVEVFVWVWGGSYGTGDWIKVTRESQTSFSFIVRGNEISGFKVARCYPGTEVPYWNYQGDWPGRIYNVSADISCSAGQFVYAVTTLYDYYPN